MFKKIILAIWDYFRPSWEGNDGKFSYKRASQFVFMHLMIILAIRGVSSQWEFYTFLTLGITFALVAGIMTVSELILMIKYYSKHNRFDYFNSGRTDTESVDALNKSNEDSSDDTDTSNSSQ